MKKPSYYLLLDRIKIQGANAISSPITYGFPAISGFLGAIHALNRKISTNYDVTLDGVLIANHQCNVKTFQRHNNADHCFSQTRNPIKKNKKIASIVEEGKVDIEVSLVVEVFTSDKNALNEHLEAFIKELYQLILQQRIAGGSVFAINQIKLFDYAKASDVLKQLIPAFILIEAKQELTDILQELQEEKKSANALDALIEIATLHNGPQKDGKWKTTTKKTGRGWLVPIPVGYQGISPVFEPNTLANCRSKDYSSQYVECLYSLGKWIFPYHLTEQFDQSFWRYKTIADQNLYLFTQEHL